MIRAHLLRTESGDEGTFGELAIGTGFKCATLELPWRGNNRGKSCIPAGVYEVVRAMSPSRKEETYRLVDVPRRDGVLIHAANLAGDAELGYVAQLEGCIAPGLSIVQFKKGNKPAGDRDQRGVSASKAALTRLEEALQLQAFELTIEWAPGVGPKEDA